jgi:hypothetical protein
VPGFDLAAYWVRYRGWRVEEENAEEESVRLRFDTEEEALQLTDPPELRVRIVAAAQAIRK